MKFVSAYKFHTLQDAVDFFAKKGLAACDVEIGGAWGLSNPTEDDDPVFFWEPVSK